MRCGRDSAVARDLGLRVTGSFRLAGVTGATGTSTAFMSGRRLNDIGLPQTNVVLTRPMPRVDPPAGAGRELTGA